MTPMAETTPDFRGRYRAAELRVEGSDHPVTVVHDATASFDAAGRLLGFAAEVHDAGPAGLLVEGAHCRVTGIVEAYGRTFRHDLGRLRVAGLAVIDPHFNPPPVAVTLVPAPEVVPPEMEAGTWRDRPAQL
jgi:hypothetical protein